MPRLRSRHVLLYIATSADYGRRIIEGILDYQKSGTRPWEFDLWPEPLPFPLDRKAHFDGVITQIRDPEVLAAVQSLSIPVVSVSQYMEHPQIPTVCADNLEVGRVGARFFLGKGFRHFAYFGALIRPYAAARLTGYREVLEASDRVQSMNVLDLSPGITRARRFRWLRSLPRPVAVLASEDSTAIQLANLCRDAGLLIPDQVSLLGVDNDRLRCRLAFPALSSIDHGAYAIGFEAARMLDRLMHRRPEAGDLCRVVQPEGVTERQSTDLAGVADDRMARAIHLIRQRACDGLTVSAVAQHLGMSRRALESAFRRHLDRSVHEVIRQTRLQRVQSLLAHSTLSLAEICEETGFSYPSRLATVFRERTGVTPSAYRRTHRPPAAAVGQEPADVAEGAEAWT